METSRSMKITFLMKTSIAIRVHKKTEFQLGVTPVLKALKIKDRCDHGQGTNDTLGGPKKKVDKIEIFVTFIQETKFM